MTNHMKMFQFLNRLCESGVTNMFGAAPYLVNEFGLTNSEARIVLGKWMQWVNENPDNLDV